MSSPASLPITAALLIAHGSRRAEANRDLAALAEQVRQEGAYPIVEIAYLELAEPSIPQGGRTCVALGAQRVLMLPYFLSAGAHVVEDLERFRSDLASEFPHVDFALCSPLSPHPLLMRVVLERLSQAENGQATKD